ncbi:MAG: putative aminohydrolase SsnA [Treponemataceae bacterium]
MTVFENVRVLSFNPPTVSAPTDVAVDGGLIAAIGNGLAAKYPQAERVAGGGRFLSPGLVCSHTHLYSALARGMLVSIQPSKDFAQQLKNLWWRLDRAIDLPILEASALAGCADAVLAGVTSLVDHHASPEAIDGSLTVIRKAYEEVGVRGLLCYETTDRNGMDGAKAGVKENIRFAKEVAADRAAGKAVLTEAAIGAHAPFTIGDETLGLLADAVKSTGRGFHIHVAEDKYDAVDSRYRFGLDPLVRLDKAGLLDERTIIGHGLWLSESEVELLSARDGFLAHNARSNMNNAVGYNTLLTKHRNVVLGTDGMGADMLEEFKFAVFRHRESVGPWWPGEFLACLDRGNRLIERYAAAEPRAPGPRTSGPASNKNDPRVFGKVEVGAAADLVLWDYESPTPLVGDNVAGHLAFGLSSRSVGSVMVAGRFAVRDKKALFDAEKIGAKGREQASRLWKRMEDR